jgi:lipopolysaccharide export system permease protein
MLKNKIYNYIAKEIAKSFITILFTFTAIAWTVRAVNFLDLMVEDGYSVGIYLQYSLFNLSSIITKFIPLAFLLALIISVLKLERNQELIVLWTSGVNKIKIANLLLLIALFVTIIQIFLALFVTPSTLNLSRDLLRNSNLMQVSSIIKTGDFSDSFKNITFYVEKKNDKGEMINIFIRDESNSLSTIISETDGASNTTIVAKKGLILQNKLVLFDGFFQSQDKLGKIKNVNFKKTEMAIDNFSTRTITSPKMQETSSYVLLQCLLNKNYSNIIIANCPFSKNKKEVVQNLSRRLGMPLYIPLISIIASFLLVYKKEKKFNFLKKYIFFLLGFFVLIFAEIMVRFSGISLTNFIIYFLFPIILMPIIYILLLKTIMSESKIQ